MHFELFDVVALTEEIPGAALRAGQTGTVVETYPGDAYEVEFSDSWGNVLDSRGFRAEQLRPASSGDAAVAGTVDAPTRA